MINRRALVVAASSGLLALPPAMLARAAGPVRRIGMLGSGTLAAAGSLIDSIRQGLRELGWIEGRNITIDYRFADGQFDRLPELAAELVRLQPDLIIAVPTPATLAASKATKSIPIVMIGVVDPVALGLVASLARPGGNVTGLSSGVNPQLVGKQLQLLKETLPKISRVAVLSNPGNAGHAAFIANARASAESLGLQLQLSRRGAWAKSTPPSRRWARRERRPSWSWAIRCFRTTTPGWPISRRGSAYRRCTSSGEPCRPEP